MVALVCSTLRKAAVDTSVAHFGFVNVLRMELAGHGVAVGSAHMSLVDTPMLHETRSRSAQFDALVAALPVLMRRPIAADKCAARLVEAIEGRKRYADVPRWVARRDGSGRC